jgi:Flp pilus assembly protein TadG
VTRVVTGFRPWRRLRGTFRRFRSGRDGATAVEFAMVGMPFFALVCALFEAGLLLLSQQTLDNAVDYAARTVFTGAFQEGYDGTPAADRLRRAVCSQVTIFPCADVMIDVATASSFAARSVASPYDAATKNVAAGFGKSFQCPSGNDVVTVRAAVVVPRYFGFLDPDALAIGTAARLVVSTVIFRAEPYATGRC